MKKLKRLSVILLILSLTAIGFAACSAPDAEGGNETQKPSGEVSVTLSVQCNTVARYDCNAFILNAANLDEDAEIEYQLADENGTFETVKTTSLRKVAYRCYEIGDFSLRAVTSVAGTEIITNTCNFTVVEDGGETFGYSPSGESPSRGVDLLNDCGSMPYIEHKSLGKSSDEYAFYKGIETDKFVFTATIDILGNNFNDQYPKSGLFAKVGKNIYYVAFDATPSGNGNTLVFATYNGATSAWSWSSGIAVNAPFRDGNGNRLTHSLTLLRNGNLLYFAVDGVFVAKQTVIGLNGNSSVGTYTMAQNTYFTNYSCCTGESVEFKNALSDAQSSL